MADFDRERLPETGKAETFTYPDTGSASGGLILSPDLDKKGKPHTRAIKDVGMARNVINTIIQANSSRNTVFNRITAKLNAERPYTQQKLDNDGLGWRQNFTTKPMPSMLNKVAPRFADAVQGMKHLTNASLSDKWLQSREKTEFFRTEFTKLCRIRPGWRSLLDDISLGNAAYGSFVCAWLDKYTWFPAAFKHDESFLTDGTKQIADSAQVVVLKETYLPHELFKQIEDKEAAEAMGWNIKNCIEAINKASPAQLRDLLGSTQTENWYQRATRELSVGHSYMAGASVITCYSLLVREVTGKVSHYRLGGIPELAELYSADDAFDTMADCVAFFSFEKGNGTMHGSKGLGRDIYEMAGMIDRSRNEVVDRAILSGKSLIQGDPRQLHKFRMSVVGMACIIPLGWNVLDQKIDGNIEPFLKLDAYFGMLSDQLVGAVSPAVPPSLQGEAGRSPQAWNIVAGREEENRDSRVTRFLEQFVVMVSTMQRRACDQDTLEEDAKTFQKRCLEKMTREELDELAKQAVAETVRDLTPMQRQMVVQIAAEKKGDPAYNHRQLEIEDLTSRVDADFAKRVLIPDEDPTVMAEQSRLQQMELALITSGQPVPVSPRDNHAVHMQILFPVLENIAGAVMQGQADTAVFEAAVAHIGEHFNYAQNFGAPKELLDQVKDLLGKAKTALVRLKQLDEQAAETQSKSQALDEEVAGGEMPPEGGVAPPPMQ